MKTSFLPRGVIGIAGSGLASGKTTLAHYLEGKGWNKIPFAETLKQAAKALDPLLEGGLRLSDLLAEGMTEEEAKRLYPEYRRILQRMGTEVGREIFGEDFWTDIWEKKASMARSVVVDDVRFLNEALKIKEKGILVFVKRAVTGPHDHASEAQNLDLEKLADVVLENSGSLAGFRTKIGKIYPELVVLADKNYDRMGINDIPF